MPNLSRPLHGRNARGSTGSDLGRDIPHDYRRKVGAWIRERRLASQLTQQDLANQLGVGFTAISAIEVGRGSVPPERYEAMADALGIDHEEFAKVMLRYSNPWAYGMLFGKDRKLKDELKEMPERVGHGGPPRPV